MRALTAEDRARAAEVLSLPMPQPNDADAATIRGYLAALLAELWENGEGFSGKRPFGNSDCEYELFTPLVSAGLVAGDIDGDGYASNVDEAAVHEVIAVAVASLAEGD